MRKPTDLGSLCDELGEVRRNRLDLKLQEEVLSRQEAELRSQIIHKMRSENLNSASGTKWSLNYGEKIVYYVTDVALYLKWVLEEGRFDALPKTIPTRIGKDLEQTKTEGWMKPTTIPLYTVRKAR